MKQKRKNQVFKKERKSRKIGFLFLTLTLLFSGAITEKRGGDALTIEKNRPETLIPFFRNFCWADYDPSTKKLYTIVKTEKGVDVGLYEFTYPSATAGPDKFIAKFIGRVYDMNSGLKDCSRDALIKKIDEECFVGFLESEFNNLMYWCRLSGSNQIKPKLIPIVRDPSFNVKFDILFGYARAKNYEFSSEYRTSLFLRTEKNQGSVGALIFDYEQQFPYLLNVPLRGEGDVFNAVKLKVEASHHLYVLVRTSNHPSTNRRMIFYELRKLDKNNRNMKFGLYSPAGSIKNRLTTFTPTKNVHYSHSDRISKDVVATGLTESGSHKIFIEIVFFVPNVASSRFKGFPGLVRGLNFFRTTFPYDIYWIRNIPVIDDHFLMIIKKDRKMMYVVYKVNYIQKNLKMVEGTLKLESRIVQELMKLEWLSMTVQPRP